MQLIEKLEKKSKKLTMKQFPSMGKMEHEERLKTEGKGVT
jgi:hypothetical protein